MSASHMGKNQLNPVLQRLINEIYDTGLYTDQWSPGINVPIFEKGNREDPANCTLITFTSAMSILFTYMLHQRINDLLEGSGILPQVESGYKKGYITTDSTFVLNTTLGFCIESFKHLCFGFIDFLKAFDKSDRVTLNRKLKNSVTLVINTESD